MTIKSVSGYEDERQIAARYKQSVIGVIISGAAFCAVGVVVLAINAFLPRLPPFVDVLAGLVLGSLALFSLLLFLKCAYEIFTAKIACPKCGHVYSAGFPWVCHFPKCGHFNSAAVYFHSFLDRCGLCKQAPPAFQCTCGYRTILTEIALSWPREMVDERCAVLTLRSDAHSLPEPLPPEPPQSFLEHFRRVMKERLTRQPPKAIQEILEQAADTLYNKFYWPELGSRPYQIWESAVIESFNGFLNSLPSGAFNEQSDPLFTAPLHNFYDWGDGKSMANPSFHPFLKHFYAPFWNDTIEKSGLLYTDYLDILKRHFSTMQFLATRTINIETARREMLAETPFEPLLDVRLPVNITRNEHLLVVGNTGSGKTSMFEYMIERDLYEVRNGASIVLIEPKGTSVERIANHKRFAKGGDLYGKLVIVEPSAEHPTALNLFDFGDLSARTETDRLALEATAFTLLSNALGSTDAPLTALQTGIFTAALKLCTKIKGANLDTLFAVLTDENTPKRKEVALLDQNSQQTFTTIWNKGDGPRARNGAAQKLDILRQTPLFTNMFQAEKSALKFDEALNEGKVILINTSDARLGAEQSGAFGAFFLSMLLVAAQRRWLLDPKSLKPVYCYVDEARTYLGKNAATQRLLDTAREANVCMTISAVRVSQGISSDVLSALMGVQAIFANTDNETDKPTLARVLRTTNLSHPTLTFIGRVKGYHQPVVVTVPPLTFSNAPRMSDAQRDEVRTQIHARYCHKPEPRPMSDFAPPEEPTDPEPDVRPSRKKKDRPTA